jgi:hypothetical protein
MILRLLKSVQPANFILHIIFAILFWVQGFLNPQVYPFFPGESQSVLYKFIHELFGNSAFISVLISLLLVISMAFFIHFINTQFAFIRVRTLLPAPIFIFILGGLTGIHTLHPVFFATFFLLFAVYRIFRIFESPSPNSAIFDSGFLLGIGVLFYFNLMVVLPAFIIAISVLQRSTKIRMFIILLIGFFLPLILTLGYSFLMDQTQDILTEVKKQIVTPNNYFLTNIPLHIFLGFIILITLIGSVKIIQQYDTKKVSTRKYFTVFFFIFIFSLVGFIFIPAVSQEMLIITAIPVCYLIANLLAFMKSKFWGNVIVLLFLGIVIFMQIATWQNG